MEDQGTLFVNLGGGRSLAPTILFPIMPWFKTFLPYKNRFEFLMSFSAGYYLGFCLLGSCLNLQHNRAREDNLTWPDWRWQCIILILSLILSVSIWCKAVAYSLNQRMFMTHYVYFLSFYHLKTKSCTFAVRGRFNQLWLCKSSIKHRTLKRILNQSFWYFTGPSAQNDQLSFNFPS